MSDLPEPEVRPGDDVDPPGGPWKSWKSIYTTLAIWGVVCILFLIWITSTLNIDVGEAPMDAEAAVTASAPEVAP
ncbi:MAG TPA: hypothetical protein VJ925_00795 [Longimicrobiales bacterium]|nr:hypothetical protein [Longimicrobiales bacterium]